MKKDFWLTAREVFEKAIGERLDGSPLGYLTFDKTNPRAIAGRIGGLKGGKARAAKLTREERRAIARKAALARWHPAK